MNTNGFGDCGCHGVPERGLAFRRLRSPSAPPLDLRVAETVRFAFEDANPSSRPRRPIMTSPASKLRTRWKVCAAMWLAATMLLNVPGIADAQVVQGVEKGAREGNKAAGPVGGVR